jgi:uncharacterized protein
MSQPFAAGPGAVLSADIAVPDHAREMRFYSRVLTTGREPLWREDLMNNLGIPIIGLGERTDQHSDLPLQWMPHIQVADVAASVKRAVDAGGSILMHAEVDGRSQWAVLLDLHGAAFGIIPVVPAGAIPPIEEPSSSDAARPAGRISWLELTVVDASAASDFYQQVVGWSVQDVAVGNGAEGYADYTMLGADGKAAAKVSHARGANAGLPPVWLIHLPVGDLAESLRRVEEEGGRVSAARRGEGGDYAYAVIQDVVGVFLALVPG